MPHSSDRFSILCCKDSLAFDKIGAKVAFEFLAIGEEERSLAFLQIIFEIS
jgi:hypothetical protein